MQCDTCGEDMIGDGYRMVLHCPYAEFLCAEADSGPIHCEGEEE